MSRGTDVVALLDFEIANVGDEHVGGSRAFEVATPTRTWATIPALCEYERVTGTPIDRRVVGYYTIAFLQLAVIGATFFMMPEIRGGNWIEGMLEKASITRQAYEAIAELGVELDHDLAPRPYARLAGGIWSAEADRRYRTTADLERLRRLGRNLLGAIPDASFSTTAHAQLVRGGLAFDIEAFLGKPFDDLAAATPQSRPVSTPTTRLTTTNSSSSCIAACCASR